MAAHETISREVNKLHVVIATITDLICPTSCAPRTLEHWWTVEKGAVYFPPPRLSSVSSPGQSCLLCIQISLDSRKQIKAWALFSTCNLMQLQRKFYKIASNTAIIIRHQVVLALPVLIETSHFGSMNHCLKTLLRNSF